MTPLEIDRRGARVNARELVALRAHFDAHHWVRIPSLLAPALLHEVQQEIASAPFVEKRHDLVTPPSIDLVMEPNATSAMLELLCNDIEVLGAMASATGCGPLERFSGSVYRLTAASGHTHHWHNDCCEGRRVAMSVNLGPGAYSGGTLLIRDRESGRVLEEAVNDRAGDAVLFRIAPELQHRAADVTAGEKTAFAGWFRAAESLRAALQGERLSAKGF